MKFLKTEGPMDSQQLAEKLGLTAMGVRQHLYALQSEKLVTAVEKKVAVGRPVKIWQLTRDADRLFPDAYAELNVALIGAIGETFGQDGLHRVIESRGKRQQSDYAARLARAPSLAEKLNHLAELRTAEGYMAEARAEPDGSYLFIERHCPICVAATACMGFCASELEVFRSVLGAGVQVERIEHILRGEARCAYRVTAAN